MKISALLIARNEEQKIINCLQSLSFVDEVITDEISIQTRYNSSDIPCKINKVDESVYEVDLVQATLGVAPGQFGVLYQNTKLVGGGRISTKILEDVNE